MLVQKMWTTISLVQYYRFTAFNLFIVQLLWTMVYDIKLWLMEWTGQIGSENVGINSTKMLILNLSTPCRSKTANFHSYEEVGKILSIIARVKNTVGDQLLGKCINNSFCGPKESSHWPVIWILIRLPWLGVLFILYESLIVTSDR